VRWTQACEVTAHEGQEAASIPIHAGGCVRGVEWRWLTTKGGHTEAAISSKSTEQCKRSDKGRDWARVVKHSTHMGMEPVMPPANWRKPRGCGPGSPKLNLAVLRAWLSSNV
jgi:hypothetical protein